MALERWRIKKEKTSVNPLHVDVKAKHGGSEMRSYNQSEHSLRLHEKPGESPGSKRKNNNNESAGAVLTFHVYALFLPEGCAQFLYLGRKPTLHVLCRELFMLGGLRRRERPVRRRRDALNERLTPPEVLWNRHGDT